MLARLSPILIAAAAPSAYAADAGQIVAAERAFARAAQEEGIGPAFRRFIAEDGLVFDPDPVPGKPVLAALPDTPGTLEWRPAFAGIAASGDLGFATGPFRFEGDRGTGHGWFFTIWRRQPDGSWRWVIDHGPPSHEPAPAGTGETVAFLASPAVPGVADARERLRAAEAALAAGLAADAPKAYAAALADDARVMRPGPQPAVGRDAFTPLLAAGPAAIEAEALGGDVSSAGDLAYTYGHARWQRDGASRRGHYVRIWQRRSEGWKLIVDEIIPVPPPRPTAAESG